jgi:hypothetical protein
LEARLTPELLLLIKSTAQGAATQVWAAVGKAWKGKGAKYLEDMCEARVVERPDMVTGGVSTHGFDEKVERELWQVSCEMVGERDVI